MGANKPNVVVIMTDQQRADLRRSEGFPCDTTPFLDRLGRSGVDFHNGYTSMPVCCPARVSLFTGRYPSAHHVKTNHNLPDAYFAKDMLDVFREAGYRTALCGKNHSHRDSADFDYTYELMHAAGHRFDKNATEQEKAFDDHLAQLKQGIELEPSGFPLECQGPYRAVTKALEWVNEPSEQPFFLWLSFAEPHSPYQVPEPYFSMFEDNLPPLYSSKDDLQNMGFKYRWLRKMWEEIVPDLDSQLVRMRKNYCGMLRLIDDQVKRFVEGLEDRGVRENTILVFLSDHGEFVGEYGLMRKGPDVTNFLSRIPIIFAGPGICARGKAAGNAYASITDILPTLCELIGADIPDGVQGRSLARFLTDPAVEETPCSSALIEHGFGGAYYDESDTLDPRTEGAVGNPYSIFDCLNSWTQCGTVRGVQKGDYKLTLDMEGTVRLFHLSDDPAELVDQSENEKYRTVRNELMEELAKWLVRVQDPLPYPRRRYVFKPESR
ncbi:MAG: sulfatase [Oscillospiraceae bacterium]